jgi:transposase InsO family protein
MSAACNTEAMNLHLAEIANAVAPVSHTVLLVDQAGWHLSARLVVPANITINHAPDIAAMDLFVVPTIGFYLLYAFVIVRIDCRDLVWINVTANPTAEWVARQITEAFLGMRLRATSSAIGIGSVTRRLRSMGIRDRPAAPASPWQNGLAERLIGSIRRECLDHIVVFGEAHLRWIPRSYARYYNDFRTHRSLDKDAPAVRPVQRAGSLRTFPILGGLHHHYLRV